MSVHTPILREQAARNATVSKEAAEFLFVTRKWAPAMGGMETWSLKIAEHLGAINPLDVVALAGRADGMPPSLLSLVFFPLTVLRRYFARAKTPNTMLLGDMALWPLAFIAAFRRGSPNVMIAAHGTDVSFHRRGGFKGTLYGAYLKLGAKLLTRAKVIANSRATAKVARETGWNNSVIVPLGTAQIKIAPTAHHNGHILFAGRLVHRKGCSWFAREVLPHLPDGIRLQIAGTGWDDGEAHVIDDPRVDFLGCLEPEELAKAYSDALCVIVPNIEPANGEYEGFGLVAPEAASVGGIVLASDHGGLRDAVIDGETGQLLPSGDAQAWIGAIMEITGWSDEKRLTAQQTASRTAREFYSWDRVATVIADLVASNRNDIQREAATRAYSSEEAK